MKGNKKAVQRQRVKTTRERHGKNAFREWGKRGGNPAITRKTQ